MKYIEELNNGDSFTYHNSLFVLSCDFKNNGDKLGICLQNGSPKWFKSNDIVDITPIYILNSENQTIAIKSTQK